jgi:hypothetical protein
MSYASNRAALDVHGVFGVRDGVRARSRDMRVALHLSGCESPGVRSWRAVQQERFRNTCLAPSDRSSSTC